VPDFSSSEFDVEVLSDRAAWDMVARNEFQCEWQSLYERCPWATAFQHPHFVLSWLTIYQGTHQPIVITGRDRTRQLCGLLVLASTSPSNRVVVAGSRQAEYHVWLALPAASDAFVRQALAQIRPRLNDGSLTFQYLPPQTPLSAVDEGLQRWVTLEPLPRPVMDTTPETLGEALKIKRKKLNQLAKLGEINFTRIVDRADLERVLEQIILFYDLRQGAISGDPPFTRDPLKRAFHLALMDSPDLLHVTTLTVGTALAAAHIGVSGRNVVHLGIIVHSPFLSQHSPGRVHLKLMAQEMAADGFQYCDLTPGADAWKEMFANRHDVVHRLTIYGREAAFKKAALIDGLKNRAGKVLRNVGVVPSDVQAILASVRSNGPVATTRSIARRVRRMAGETTELRVYDLPLPSDPGRLPDDPIRRDSIGDLLAFAPAHGTQDVKGFFATALERLEKGQHPYTRVEHDRLIHWGWIAEHQKESFLDEVEQSFVLPPATGVLFDFYTHPDFRRRGYYERTLRKMIGDANRTDLTQLYIFVEANNRASRSVIEKIGFRYRFSFWKRRIGTTVTKWRDDVTETSAPRHVAEH
jgi:CelD/BcsL family acetyltransferase involved in cellulose biosynthesis/GNAT superfamily N-acetyltransferase